MLQDEPKKTHEIRSYQSQSKVLGALESVGRAGDEHVPEVQVAVIDQSRAEVLRRILRKV